MSASRETHHADPIGLVTVLPSMRPHPANGTLSILQFNRMVIARAEPVLQYKCGNAHTVEQIGELSAFVIAGKHRVAAPRRDQDCCTRARCFEREKDGDRWRVLICSALRSRSAMLPQWKRLGFGGKVELVLLSLAE